jgi:hypothetical protein
VCCRTHTATSGGRRRVHCHTPRFILFVPNIITHIRATFQELAKSLRSAPGKLYPLKCDVSNESDVKETFKWVKSNLGAVDILINNAGVADHNHLIGKYYKCMPRFNCYEYCNIAEHEYNVIYIAFDGQRPQGKRYKNFLLLFLVLREFKGMIMKCYLFRHIMPCIR